MMCDIRDFPAVAHLNRLSSLYAIDLMEAGSICALLMELREREIITSADLKEWTGRDLVLSWGDWEGVAFVLESLAFQKNQLGEIFREGVYRGALKLEEIKGIPVTVYVNYGKGGSPFNEEVRPFPTWATNMAVASRGADHLKGLAAMDKWGGIKLSRKWFGRPEAGERFTPTLKGAASAKAENFSTFINSLGFCILSSGMGVTNLPLDIILEAYCALTGLKLTEEDLWTIGERICNLEKAFNTRLGLTRKDDKLCPRWLEEPAADGPGKGLKAGDYIEQTLDEYYEFRGWDRETGLPRKETLLRLGLDEVAAVLEREGRLAD
jgi:aldehyde:ferredoxin oxidoreductase